MPQKFEIITSYIKANKQKLLLDRRNTQDTMLLNKIQKMLINKRYYFEEQK